MRKIYALNRLNNRYDRPISKLNRKLYVFYHVYCGPNDWEGIVSEQVQFFNSSGLWQRVSKLYVSAACVRDGDLERLVSYLSGIEYEIIYESNNGSCFEFPCMQKMQKLASVDKFYALYIHTKGSSYTRSKFDGPRQMFDFKQIQCIRWRNLMNYYNLYKWNIAVNVLLDGYDAYGILYRKLPKEHFSGNFWWATSECIIDTQYLSPEFMKDRYNAEFLILNDRNGIPNKKVYSPFFSGLLGFVENKHNNIRLLPWWHYRNLIYLLVSQTLAH